MSMVFGFLLQTLPPAGRVMLIRAPPVDGRRLGFFELRFDLFRLVLGDSRRSLLLLLLRTVVLFGY